MLKLTQIRKYPKEHTMLNSNPLRQAIKYCMPLMLPFLSAMIPSLYHYSNNVEILTVYNLLRVLSLNFMIALLFLLVVLVLSRFQATKAANLTFIVLIFFNVYGLAYRHLVSIDIVRVKHYNLLPLTIMAAVYSGLFIAKFKDSIQRSIWKNLFLVSSVLVLFNLAMILPSEIKKWNSSRAYLPEYISGDPSFDKGSPDIYYIVFDEFAGFEAMRTYWRYEEVDYFVEFLHDRGFFVAEAAHGNSRDTLREMASRLNYQEYSKGTTKDTYFNEMADNQVMRYLKSRGYTIVVFDERKQTYPSAKSIRADYVYEYAGSSIPELEMSEVEVYGLYLDEFGELVMNNTMFYALPQKLQNYGPLITRHTGMIRFTVDNIASKEIDSPKFVYVHLLLPHVPFMYDRNGNILASIYFTNWNYYIESYIYSIKLAEEMIDNILKASDPANPPVIILQSDHGARNNLGDDEGSQILPDYPEEFKTLILYALYIPGYDVSGLPQDINPTNTFPIVFNHLFNAGIPLIK